MFPAEVGPRPGSPPVTPDAGLATAPAAPGRAPGADMSFTLFFELNMLSICSSICGRERKKQDVTTDTLYFKASGRRCEMLSHPGLHLRRLNPEGPEQPSAVSSSHWPVHVLFHQT